MPAPVPATGRVLAVDAGTVRVGLAISDPGRTFAFPLEVVAVKESIPRIRDVARQESIGVVIVGLPLSMNGEEGPEADRVRRWMRKLAAALEPIPVVTQDERLSSAVADRALSPRARRARARGEQPKRDAVAAALILESWLARERRPPS